MLLVTPAKVALTFIAVPLTAPAAIVPVPLPLVSMRSVVSLLVQVTEAVMSCCALLPGKVAKALNVKAVLRAGVVVDALNVIWVGVPPLTVTLVVAGLTVPNEALIVVLHTPLTFETGLTRPLPLTEAQLVVEELHSALPVRSFVVPSL